MQAVREEARSPLRIFPTVAFVALTTIYTGATAGPVRSSSPVVWTQEQLRDGLEAEVDTRDPKAVLRYVVSGLPRAITVYPSEQYYYVLFAAAGRFFRGSFNFYERSLDDGRFVFSYDEIADFERPLHDRHEGVVEVGPEVGASLVATGDDRYELRYEGRTTAIRFVRPARVDPESVGLAFTEELVGSVVDESGLHFFLVYSGDCRELAWILDETGPVRETFVSFHGGLSIGTRTGFAFVTEETDAIGARKVLVGVRSEHEEQNTWYDGPFDQLPDHEIRTGQVRLGEYLVRVDPALEDRIDQYGRWLNQTGSRVAVTPYTAYSHVADLVAIVVEARSRTEAGHSLVCGLLRAVARDREERTRHEGSVRHRP